MMEERRIEDICVGDRYIRYNGIVVIVIGVLVENQEIVIERVGASVKWITYVKWKSFVKKYSYSLEKTRLAKIEAALHRIKEKF